MAKNKIHNDRINDEDKGMGLSADDDDDTRLFCPDIFSNSKQKKKLTNVQNLQSCHTVILPVFLVCKKLNCDIDK